jgi:hypothetical protein
MTLPNFMIIGAQKAGTTSLYNYLKGHPEVFMSRVKETHFFSYQDWEGSHATGRRRITEPVRSLEAYQRLFEGAGSAVARGEASPSYLYSRNAPGRIHSLIPEVRLIAVLRNPADRAYSNYLHCRRHGIEPLSDFRTALAAEDARTKEGWEPIFHYKAKGFYSRQLLRYFDCFAREQIEILLYEDLRRDPNLVLGQIFEFIQVDAGILPSVLRQYNVAGAPRNPIAAALIKASDPFRPMLESLIPDRVRHAMRGALMVRPNMPAGVREELAREYREEILQLEILIDRDLSAWLH